jgi:predicted HAD superfamily Cof-like phosphohydrolase
MGRSSSEPDPAKPDRDQPPDMAANVAEFHAAFGLPMRGRPSADIDPVLARRRVALLEEEVGEYIAAVRQGDLEGIADGLADIVYVAFGTALTYGIDLNAVLREVHRSNMSKLGTAGKPCFGPDGKVAKPAGYSPPDIAAVLSRQAAAAPGFKQDPRSPATDAAAG